MGLELARVEGAATAAVPRGGLPLLDEERYPLFRGDGAVPPALASFAPSRLRIPALGLDAAMVTSERQALPATRFAVGAYYAFCAERSLLEAVASSLTELFSPVIIGERVPAMLARPLSAREAAIMGWLQAGKSNREIGQILDISALTVKNHLQRIYRLLGVANRAHALARCLELRLLGR